MARVDNASIPKGKEIHITVKSYVLPAIKIEAYTPLSKEIQTLSHTTESVGELHQIRTTTPPKDGFILLSVNNKRIVKKLGHPVGFFIIGVDLSSAFIRVDELDESMELIKSSNAHTVSDGFFELKLHQKTAIVRAGGKYFDIRKYQSFLGFEVGLEDVVLDCDITLEDVALQGVALQEVALNDISIADVSICDVAIQEMIIKEL